MTATMKAVATVLLLTGTVTTAVMSAQQRRPPGLFSPLDLGLLEPPDREAWQKPEEVMDALYVGEGSVVADLGAGGGWFTIRLARRVAPNGTVYAVEREGLTNVKTVLGTGADPFPGLAPGTLDAVLIVDAFHEMTEPVVLLRNVARALKPQGRIGIIDYREGDGGPGPRAEERVPPKVIVATAKDAGLTLAGEAQFLPFQYFLIFRK
jgi:predicted methyltransferase